MVFNLIQNNYKIISGELDRIEFENEYIKSLIWRNPNYDEHTPVHEVTYRLNCDFKSKHDYDAFSSCSLTNFIEVCLFEN